MRRIVRCNAHRSGKLWVAHVPECGVFGQGSSLRATAESVRQGLALIGVAADVEVAPAGNHLDRLRTAQAAYQAALRAAVRELARRKVSVSDIAHATGIAPSQVRAMMPAKRAPTGDRASG